MPTKKAVKKDTKDTKDTQKAEDSTKEAEKSKRQELADELLKHVNEKYVNSDISEKMSILSRCWSKLRKLRDSSK